MAAVDEIAIKLGVKTGDLKSALTDANAQIKTFKQAGEGNENKDFLGIKSAHKSLEEFKKFIVAGGVITAVLELFNVAYEKAKLTEGAIDNDTAAVLRMGATMDKTKELFSAALQTAVGWFARLGEGIGKLAGGLIYGKEAVKDSEKLAAVESARILEKAKEEKVNQVLVGLQQQLTAEAQKHHDLTVAELTDNEKIGKLMGELFNADRLLREAGEDKVKHAEALLVVKKAENALLEVQVQMEKKKREEAKAAADAEWKDANAKLDLERESMTLFARRKSLLTEEAALKNIISLTDEKSKDYAEYKNRLLETRKGLLKTEEEQGKANLEIATLLLKGKENLTDVEKEHLKLLRGQTTEKQQQAEVVVLLSKGVENLTAIDRARLMVLTGQTAEIKQQLATTESYIAAWNGFSGNLEQRGDVKTLSNVQLAQLGSNLQGKLDVVTNADRLQGGVGTIIDTYKSTAQLLYQSNLDAVKREQEARRDFEETVKFFGKQYAERTFTPDEYSRLSQLFNPDVQKAQATDIAGINRTLTNLFPKQAAGFQNPKS